MQRVRMTALMALLACLVLSGTPTLLAAAGSASSPDSGEVTELGRRMYMEGVLPSGEMMTATIRGDIVITGDQVICGTCHRRSGLGSSEGQEVVPAVAGPVLYEALRLPTSKPPLAPELRPAYTDETLMRAIREGIGAGGDELSSFMPRYTLTNTELDLLLGYLKSLETETAPGVTEKDIHFATVVGEGVPPAARDAMLDVLRVFFEQKNAETRHESERAAHAPWHKAWKYQPYRKWVLHEWQIEGDRSEWPAQLQAHYRRQPVFAVLGGVAPGEWQPIHDFCENERLPCLFPTTDLPVRDEEDFYTFYFASGMAGEGAAIVQHLVDDGWLAGPLRQVYRAGDPAAETAARALRSEIERRGGTSSDLALSAGAGAEDQVYALVREQGQQETAVLWLGEKDLQPLWEHLDGAGGGAGRIYVSTTLYTSQPEGVPASLRKRIYFVHPEELPARLPRLLARATGWLRVKRIQAPDQRELQANTYFVLKIAGGALADIHGYFNREYFLERIEHMVDNATFSSVYPHVSLAPNQRFVSKGCFIAQLPEAGEGGLVAVSGWLIPGSK